MSSRSFVQCLLIVSGLAMLSTGPSTGKSDDAEARSGDANSQNMKVVDGFGAQLWFVDVSFLDQWLKGGAPRLRPVRVAQRGKHYLPAIIFAGAAPDKNNNADITYDITIYTPDGSVYGEQKDLVVWNRQVGAGMQLCEKYLTVEIEPNDPSGRYLISVTVRDNNRKLEIPLKTSFDVEEN